MTEDIKVEVRCDGYIDPTTNNKVYSIECAGRLIMPGQALNKTKHVCSICYKEYCRKRKNMLKQFPLVRFLLTSEARGHARELILNHKESLTKAEFDESMRRIKLGIQPKIIKMPPF